jgi:hypothetical protein
VTPGQIQQRLVELDCPSWLLYRFAGHVSKSGTRQRVKRKKHKNQSAKDAGKTGVSVMDWSNVAVRAKTNMDSTILLWLFLWTYAAEIERHRSDRG